MNFKKILNTPSDNRLLVIQLRGLDYVKTYTVEAFKRYFMLDKVTIKKHPTGFLFFEFRDQIGLLLGNMIPKNNPAISVVIDQFGEAMLIMHPFDYRPSDPSISILKSKVKNSLSETDYYSDTLDAFEGDEDAYWNID